MSDPNGHFPAPRPVEGLIVEAVEARYAQTGLDAKVAKFREVYQPLRLYEELALARGLLEQFLQSWETQNATLKRCVDDRGLPLPKGWLGPDDAVKHLRLVADLVTMIHKIEGADLVAREQRRTLVRQIGQVVEQEVQGTADNPEAGWQRALLLRIRDRWKKILT